jgi:hypothetical protein
LALLLEPDITSTSTSALIKIHTITITSMADRLVESPVKRDADTMDDASDIPESISVPAATEDNALVTINTDGKKVIKKIIKKKKRPARPQVDPATFKTEPPPQTGM